MRRTRRWYRRHVIPTPHPVPYHGGTPSEMLNDLADFLDRIGDASDKLVVNAPGSALDGWSLHSVLGLDDDERTMQSDIRWLADQLDTEA